jgi:dinuclear metal center YbgI/SA1388 family protein
VTGSPVPLPEVVQYLDDYLRVREAPDAPVALNGLQAENSGTVGRLIAAVDASLETIRGVAAPSSPSLLLVHHGMFWDGLRPATGRRYLKLRALFDRDLALYSAHIPLDMHPEVGNNAVLAGRLGLTGCTPFGEYRGVPIGVMGTAPVELQTCSALADAVARILGIAPAAVRTVAGGPERIRRVGIVTGSAGEMIGAASEAGCDAFVTGEGPAHSYFDAVELGVNVLFAGHYATETVGVQALAAHLAARFGLPWEFHDHPTGM